MEKDKLLNLMRFWLFGTFIIVFAATFTYVGLFTDRDWVQALTASLPIWGITAVLCVIWYFVYKWYADRKFK
ncbi:MAG: hypothetical protein PHQ40_19555 [Anaerolineaceae bacterium]|nr:hypothetical protein [Anaerolineaceae bacterium]